MHIEGVMNKALNRDSLLGTAGTEHKSTTKVGGVGIIDTGEGRWCEESFTIRLLGLGHCATRSGAVGSEVAVILLSEFSNIK